MPEVLVCRRCGAPLPPGKPGDVVTCAHCGTSSHLPGGAPAPIVGSETAGSGRVVLVLAALVGLGVAAGGAFLLVASPTSRSVSTSTTTTTTTTSSQSVTVTLPSGVTLPEGVELPEGITVRGGDFVVEAQPAAPSRLPWTALAQAPEGRWVAIEPPPPITPLSAFEPALHLEWAERIARAWSPDAVVVRMDVGGVRRDGGLDLVAYEHASLRYVAVSPTRRVAAREIAKVSHDVPPWALVITIDDGVVEAMIDDHWELPDAATEPMRSPCTMAQVLAALGDDLPEQPDHDVRLDWRVPYQGLAGWTFDVGGTYVFPEDCTRWTLQEARRRR